MLQASNLSSFLCKFNDIFIVELYSKLTFTEFIKQFNGSLDICDRK